MKRSDVVRVLLAPAFAALAVLLVLVLPGTAAAVVAPSEGTLPDLDVREQGEPDKPSAGDIGAGQADLQEDLGPLAFVDADPLLGGTAFAGRTNGYLTGASDAPAGQIVLGYLAGERAAFGLDRGDLAGLELTEAYTSAVDGIRHLSFAQVVDGVPSYDTFVTANVDGKGRLINIGGSPVGDLALSDADAGLSRSEALKLARENVGAAPGGGFGEMESARKVAFAGADGKATLAWAVNVESEEGYLYEVVLDADSGEVLSRISRTDFLNQADVWDHHADQTVPPTRVNLGADPAWIDNAAGGTRLFGNNAHAYSDLDDSNAASPSEEVPQVGGDWIFAPVWFNQAECPAFGCTWDSTNAAGTKPSNRERETTNLFYLVNKYHDHLLAPPIGFDEASRNFERVNTSGQGLGGDQVNAESNDGGGVNNANFSTPADGTPGRMQMYFFDASWDVNSSDDAEVVYHEFTHGLTNRLIGNGSGLANSQSRAMGEGWSDWFALDYLVSDGEVTDGPGVDVALGKYTIASLTDFGYPGTYGGGIRRQHIDCKVGLTSAPQCPSQNEGASPEATGPGGYTFGDIDKVGTSVHDVGEIWSQTLWDLRDRLGAPTARSVIASALRLTPNNPTFVQARDAILQAAFAQGVSQGPIWDVFAARGLGYGATTASSNSFTGTESFTNPWPVLHTGTTVRDPAPLGDGDGSLEPGETGLIDVELTNAVNPASVGAITGSMTAADPGVLVGTPDASWPNIANGAAANASAPFSVTVPASKSCANSFNLAFTVGSNAGAVSVPAKNVEVGSEFYSDEPELAIPDNPAVQTTINLPSRTISDLDVAFDDLRHTYMGDLDITLTSPQGTTVALMNDRGGSADNAIGLLFDDSAAQPISAGSAPFTGSFRPEQALSAFNGENAAGAWTLTIDDDTGGDTGVLHKWGLRLNGGTDCSTTAPQLPTAVTNAASDVDGSSATLNAQVDPKNGATVFAFDYGKTAAYGTRSALGNAGAGTESTTVSGLDPNTTYHYRVVALRAGTVIAVGADRALKTTAGGSDNAACERAGTVLKKAQKKLKQASKKVKKAKKKLKKAKGKKKKSAKKKLKKAKQKQKQAKKKVKKAKQARDEAC